MKAMQHPDSLSSNANRTVNSLSGCKEHSIVTILQPSNENEPLRSALEHPAVQ